MHTAGFPQADRILQVGMVALAVASDCHSYHEIEEFIGLSSRGRQGRYYRLAAEILGLIRTSSNYSELTPMGAVYTSIHRQTEQLDFLARCVVDTPVFKAALEYIGATTPTRMALRIWLTRNYDGSSRTAGRRYSSLTSYLFDTSLIRESGDGSIVLTEYAVLLLTQGSDNTNALGYSINPRSIRPYTAKTQVNSYEFNAVALERANEVHENLVLGKANFLSAMGFYPRRHDRIDLYATGAAGTIIYEMKSVHELNIISQTRSAIAQLYEYSYAYSFQEARLCIVTNAPYRGHVAWLNRYLEEDRGIAHVWTNNYRDFHCSSRSRELLGEFEPSI